MASLSPQTSPSPSTVPSGSPGPSGSPPNPSSSPPQPSGSSRPSSRTSSGSNSNSYKSSIILSSLSSRSSGSSSNSSRSSRSSASSSSSASDPTSLALKLSLRDASGVLHRKIALNGLPSPDEKPQAKPETDESTEETFVDALTLNLRHDTSDIYIPLVGDELALGVKRSLSQEIWTDGPGFPAQDAVDRPFGPCWTTGLAANVRFSWLQKGTASPPMNPRDPDYAVVTDENGATHRFAVVWNKAGIIPPAQSQAPGFLPLPDNQSEQEGFLMTLEAFADPMEPLNRSKWTYVFRRKFGTTLRFQACAPFGGLTQRSYLTNPDTPSSSDAVIEAFARLTHVIDRYSVSTVNAQGVLDTDAARVMLRYVYNIGNNGIIPDQIEANVAGDIRLLDITRDPNKGGKITAIKLNDPSQPGAAPWVYDYSSIILPAAGPNGASGTLWRLTKVTSPMGKIREYTYANSSQVDLVAAAAENKSQNYYFLCANTIASGVGPEKAIYTFTYQDDQSRLEGVRNPSGVVQWPVVCGLPKVVKEVLLPLNGWKSRFEPDWETNINRRLGYLTLAQGTALRENKVTDTTGQIRTWKFSVPVVRNANEFEDLFFPENDGRRRRWDALLLWTKLEIINPSPFGQESFYFDDKAMMALKRTIDLSGTETLFEHADVWDIRYFIPWLPAVYATGDYFAKFYPEPTAQNKLIGAISYTKTFKYYSSSATYDPPPQSDRHRKAWSRVMTEIVDEEGRKTTYELDATWGRRVKETIVKGPSDPASANKVTDFTYDLGCRAFMLTSTVQSGTTNSSGTLVPLVTTFDRGAHGLVAKETTGTVVASDRLATSYLYDLWSRKTKATDRRGSYTTFGYDGDGRLTSSGHGSTSQPGTDSRQFTYDTRGNKLTETDERGVETRFVYDLLNRLTTKTVKAKPTLPASDVDLVTSYTQTALGSLATETDPRGTVTQHLYDAINRRTQTTVALGGDSSLNEPAVTQFFYETTVVIPGAPTSQTYPGGSVFDSSVYRPTRIQGPGDMATRIIFDALGRKTAEGHEYESGQWAVSQFGYDKVGNQVSSTDPRGNQTATVFDFLNRPFRVTQPDTSATETTYTMAGLVTRVSSLFNTTFLRETLTRYTSAGLKYSEIGPDPVSGVASGAAAPITMWTYDTGGNVATIVPPRGNVSGGTPAQFQTQYQYDFRNRQTKEIQPPMADAENGGAVVSPEFVTIYDAGGLAIQRTDARGATTTTDYDYVGRPVKVCTPPAPVHGGGTQVLVTETVYDPVGNVVDVKDPLGNKTLNAYDRRNRLIATKTNPVVVTSGSAGVSNNSNDIIVKYTYDVVGNRLKLIDAKGCVTQFTYDRINRLKTTVHDAEAVPGSGQPDVRTVEIDVYDAVVKISRKEGLYPNATGGLEFSYSYDNRLRLTTTTVVAGGTAADNSTRSYDELNRMWKVEQAADSGGTPRRVEYTFDRLDRILTENSAGLTNTSQYDVAGNRLTITYQSTQRTLTTAFDSHNRPTQIVDTQTGSSTTRTTTYGYNRNGSTVTKGLPNGVTETRGYDVLNRVNSIEAKGPGSSPVVFQSTTQSYDAASNLARIVETYPSTGVASRTVTNAYDRTYRLQSETAVVGSTTTITSWSYDKANNRLTESKQINGGTVLTTTYTIGDGTNGIASNQIKQFVRPGTGGTVGFTYNAFGNRATRADSATTVLTTYSYDPFSRLTQVLQSDSGTGQTRTHRYAYDYRTRRVVRHEPATLINGTPFPEGGLARRIVFSGGLSVLEYSGTGTTGTSLALQIIRGSDMGGGVGGILYALPYSVSGPQPTYFNFNSRGDVTTQTANTPGTTPTYQAAYEAFGSHPQQMGTAVTRHKANTKEEDPTGLLNEGFRYRDLETGAFITRDPAGFVDGPNLYTYVNQNPWTKFDPEGLFWSAIVTAGFAVYDTYQYASGNISGADYSGRMALNGAALLADAATGGMGGGVAIRTAALAARAGKVGQVAIKAAVAIDRADTAVSTAQAAISTTEAVEDGNYGRAAISAVQVAVTGKGMTKSAREVAEDTRKGVIALSEGRLSVGSSNAFDKGQREMADKLNLERVPTKRGHHAEENLMAAKDDLTAVGTYKRAPCGPSEHNCAGQLAERGIKESPFLGQVAKKVNNAGLSEPSRNRRTIAVGESAPKKFRTEDD